MPDSTLRDLRNLGIPVAVTRSAPGASPRTQIAFTAGEVSVRWVSHHTPSGNTVEMHRLPVRDAPAVLNAVGATVDTELDRYRLPDDYEGEAARWLDSQTGHALGLVAMAPLPGHEDDALPPTYTAELSATWRGSEHAIVELSGPSMNAACSLWIYNLPDPAARAVLSALTQTLAGPPPADGGPTAVRQRPRTGESQGPGPRATGHPSSPPLRRPGHRGPFYGSR
ncbi:hypothetical protein ABZ714_28620 [Streptomyces sp. NPDC006798]|uniref:hypothetical protein n=1 Tax=Streptomyces sp. NPDC006798 TaxID=3155462 RepID=UPI0033C1DAF5